MAQIDLNSIREIRYPIGCQFSSLSGCMNRLQYLFNGKPQATVPGLLTAAIAYGLPSNEFMRLLVCLK
jgi:hypothetical protein